MMKAERYPGPATKAGGLTEEAVQAMAELVAQQVNTVEGRLLAD
jgi:hypothetical protein